MSTAEWVFAFCALICVVGSLSDIKTQLKRIADALEKERE